MGLETDQYPSATFASAAPIELPSTALSGAVTRAQATGDLTIHGAAKRVTIPLEVKASGSQVEVLGSLTFPFADFGMSAPNVGGLVTVESNPTWSSSWCSSGQRDYLLYISSLSSSNVV